jgi:hypothetical protein
MTTTAVGTARYRSANTGFFFIIVGGYLTTGW